MSTVYIVWLEKVQKKKGGGGNHNDSFGLENLTYEEKLKCLQLFGLEITD